MNIEHSIYEMTKVETWYVFNNHMHMCIIFFTSSLTMLVEKVRRGENVV
jgi:hypothetical protein